MSALPGAFSIAIATDLVNPATTGAVTTQASGSSFFIFVGFQGSTTPTVSDSKSNSYTQVGSTVLYADSSGGAAVFKCENGAGGSGHTASCSLPGDFKEIAFLEVVGAVTSGIVDRAPAGNDATTSPYTSNSTGTTVQADELAVSWAVPADADGTETRTWGNSFVELEGEPDAHIGFTGGLATRSLSATGSYQSSLTITSTIGPVTECLLFILTLKSATGPSLSPPTIYGARPASLYQGRARVPYDVGSQAIPGWINNDFGGYFPPVIYGGQPLGLRRSERHVRSSVITVPAAPAAPPVAVVYGPPSLPAVRRPAHRISSAFIPSATPAAPATPPPTIYGAARGAVIRRVPPLVRSAYVAGLIPPPPPVTGADNALFFGTDF